MRFNPNARVDVSTPIGDVPTLVAQGPKQTRTGGATNDLVAQRLMGGTIGTLRFVLDGLRDMPGRKSLILFSQGYPIWDKNQGFQIGKSASAWGHSVMGLVELANRSSTVIYTVDPVGVQTRGLTAMDNLLPFGYDNRSDEVYAKELHAATLERHAVSNAAEREGAAYLADATGGLSLRGSNDPSTHLAQIMDDQQGYYLIGYVPLAASFEVEASRPAFHKIKIEVRRKDLKVRSRVGFYGIADDDARLGAQRKALAMHKALVSPFLSSEVALRLNSLFFDDAARGPLLRSFLRVGTGGLTFAPAPDGSVASRVEILAVTFDADGRAVDQLSRTGELRLSAEAYERAQRRGVQYVLDVPVQKPGAYQLRVALRDLASSRVGSAYQFVDVPNLSKKRLAVSGILLTAGAATATADPTLAEVGYAFAPGQSLAYGFAVYNATPRGKEPGLVQTQMRIFGDDGREVVAGAPRQVDLAESGAPVVGGRFELPAGLVPGDYVLQVQVTKGAGTGKEDTASQTASFQVAP